MSVVIKIEDVSKLYRLGVVGTGTLSHDLNRWWHLVRGKEDPYAKLGHVNDRTKSGVGSKQTLLSSPSSLRSQHSPDYVWALRDINLEVEQGEILGIIGRNGAGKSTLLKILSRVTAPTTGCIKSRGRIASLLEVGTGFHPELTGRENIYLNGVILGMRHHEVTKQLDAIVDFSGCAKYLDTPVKRYSSGMTVRLGFAVAAHLQPHVLIVDEVLAVGDASFQEKCVGKMSELGTEGRTILFVSHNMAAIEQLTRRCFVINDGQCVYEGSSADSVDYYLDRQKRALGTTTDVSQLTRVSWAGDQAAKIVTADLPDLKSGRHMGGLPIRIRLGVVAQEDVAIFSFGITLHYRDGTPVGCAFGPKCGPIHSGENQSFELQLTDPALAPGHYWMTVGLLRGNCELVDVIHEVLHFDLDASQRIPQGCANWHPAWGRIRLEITCSSP